MNILPSLIDSSLTNQPYMLLLPLGLILIVGKLLSGKFCDKVPVRSVVP